MPAVRTLARLFTPVRASGIAGPAERPDHVAAGSRWILVGGLGVWLAVHAVVIGRPLAARHMPTRPDDSYTYIIKAAQLKTCPTQDAPALNDLRAQLGTPSADPEIAWQRWRNYTKTFFVYHLSHSALMVGLEAAGLSWEAAWKVTTALGGVFLGLALAYFLGTVWGAAPAGFALGLLAFQVFPGQGLHFVVPSNLALGIALVVWGRVVVCRGHAPWSLTIGTSLLVSMHTIGSFYAAVAVVLAVALAGIPWSPRRWAPVVVSGLLIAASFVVPALVSRPEMRVVAPPLPAGHSAVRAAGHSVTAAALMVHDWAQIHGWSWLIPLGVIGLVCSPRPTRQVAARALLVIGAFTLFSLCYVMPRYPAEMFGRTMIAAAVLVTGAVGQAVWLLLRQLPPMLRRARSDGEDANLDPSAVERALGTVAVVVVLATVAGLCVQTMTAGYDALRKKTIYMTEVEDYHYDPRQPANLLALASPGDKVLYNDEITMPFYLAHGAMALGAIYHPALAGSPEEKDWLSRPELRFAAVMNPAQALVSKGAEPSVRLSRDGWLDVRIADPISARRVRVLVENSGSGTVVEISSFECGAGVPTAPSITQAIQARGTGWIEIDLSPLMPCSGFRIRFPEASATISVRGLAFDADQGRWPWSQKATLTVAPEGEGDKPRSARFDPDQLLPKGLARKSVAVVDDASSSVLLRIVKE